MPLGIVDNKLTLVQVMAWCSQASTGLILLSCCSDFDKGIVTKLAHTTILLLNCMHMFFLCGAIKFPISRARGIDLRVYDIVSHYFLKIRRVKLVIALKHSHDGFHRSSKNFHFDIE